MVTQHSQERLGLLRIRRARELFRAAVASCGGAAYREDIFDLLRTLLRARDDIFMTEHVSALS